MLSKFEFSIQLLRTLAIGSLLVYAVPGLGQVPLSYGERLELLANQMNISSVTCFRSEPGSPQQLAYTVSTRYDYASGQLHETKIVSDPLEATKVTKTMRVYETKGFGRSQSETVVESGFHLSRMIADADFQETLVGTDGMEIGSGGAEMLYTFIPGLIEKKASGEWDNLVRMPRAVLRLPMGSYMLGGANYSFAAGDCGFNSK